MRAAPPRSSIPPCTRSGSKRLTWTLCPKPTRRTAVLDLDQRHGYGGSGSAMTGAARTACRGLAAAPTRVDFHERMLQMAATAHRIE